MGFIPELEDFPSLAGQVSTGIQRPNSLVGDLQMKNRDRKVRRVPLHLALLCSPVLSPLRLNCKLKDRNYFRIISVSPVSGFVFGCCHTTMTIFPRLYLGKN